MIIEWSIFLADKGIGEQGAIRNGGDLGINIKGMGVVGYLAMYSLKSGSWEGGFYA